MQSLPIFGRHQPSQVDQLFPILLPGAPLRPRHEDAHPLVQAVPAFHPSRQIRDGAGSYQGPCALTLLICQCRLQHLMRQAMMLMSSFPELIHVLS